MADINYGNNNELAFDYLRDKMSTVTEKVKRGLTTRCDEVDDPDRRGAHRGLISRASRRQHRSYSDNQVAPKLNGMKEENGRCD